jgi:hypothetical protein
LNTKSRELDAHFFLGVRGPDSSLDSVWSSGGCLQLKRRARPDERLRPEDN